MESMWMLGLFSLFTITILLVEVALVINVPLVIREHLHLPCHHHERTIPRNINVYDFLKFDGGTCVSGIYLPCSE